MKVLLRFSFLLLLLSFVVKSTGQLPSPIQVHISYPRIKVDKPFFLFLAKKNMGKIEFGQRITYNFYTGGLLKVTIQESDQYIEPKTIAGNTRNINLKAGASYYFEINGRGELVYLPDPLKGREAFEKKN